MGIFDFLKKLGNNLKIYIYGYAGSSNKFVEIPAIYNPIFMCGVLIEKNNHFEKNNKFSLEVPLELLK